MLFTSRYCDTQVLRRCLVTILLVFLLSSLPQIFVSANIFDLSSSAISSSSPANQYQDRAIALDNSQGRVTLGLLNSLTGGSQSVGAYEKAISDFFLPLNIRQVLLDIGWENYSIGNIPNETWVSNWLSACDALGINNLFYMGQFTKSGIGSPWIMSLIKSDPTTQTYFSNGQPANYISFDNPDVAKAVENDLSILYSFYGNHTSWVGLGTGSTKDNPYYAGGGALPSLGYSNSTVQQFVNSVYFQRDVNQSGYLPTGSLDQVWASYKNIGNSIQLSSGNYVYPSTQQVYGNNTFAQMLEMKFYVPQNESSIQIQWYGNRVGSPNDLKTIIYRDQGGTPNPTQTQVAIGNESSSSVSSVPGWNGPIQYAGSFSQGYYWIIFEAPSINDRNYYNIYTENQGGTNSSAFLTLSNSAFSLGGRTLYIGSSILWVENQTGSNLSVYPLLSLAPSQVLSQSFVANSSFSFNTVFLYIGPKVFSSGDATISIVDETTGGQIVSQGTLSQNSIHGLEGWVPVSLGNIVTTSKASAYQIQISHQPGDNSWNRVVESVFTNPSGQGFQNQGQYWLFQIGLLGFSKTHFDYSAINAGPNEVKQNESLAFRFTPSTTETLQSVELLMKSNAQGISYYNSGALTVSLWTNSRTGTSPGTQILQSVTVPGQAIPQNGYLTVPGFDFQVTGGQSYWIVLSSSDPVGYTLAQFGNPYFSNVKLSLDGGTFWLNPASGASDLSYKVILSGETIGNVVNGIESISLSSSSTIFAQPFSVSSATDLSGLFLGPIALHRLQSPSDQLSISVQEDNGRGQPSGVSLASGNIGVRNITSSTLDYVGFPSIVKLQPGVKYWIVIEPQTGNYIVQPDSYSSTPPGIAQGYNALVSTNSGNSWSNATGSGSEVSVLSYSLVTPYSSHPTFNTTGIYTRLLGGHALSTQNGVLRGWNAFAQASQANIFSSILSSFQILTGKSLTFYAGIDQNVIDQLGYVGNIFSVAAPPDSCSNLYQLLLNTAPLQNSQYIEGANSSLTKTCLSPNVNDMGQELNYLVYAGRNTGPATSSKILLIGDNGPYSNIQYYLSNAYSLTYATLGSTPSLFLPGGLASYSTVVWLSSTSPDLGYSRALQSYVNGGGRLIVVGTSSSTSSLVSNWLYPFIGFNPSQIPSSNQKIPPSEESTFYSMTANTPYNQSLSFRAVSGSTSIASGTGLTLGENILNNTNGGKVVFVQFAGQNVTQLPQLSNQIVVLSNVIASSLKGVGTSPFFYSTGTASESNSGVVYGITGGTNTALLVWLSNPTGSTVNVNLELNGSFYGLPPSWSLIDLQGLSVSSGSGELISVSTTIAPQSWKPFYVVPDSSKPSELYSNVPLLEQFSYPNQGLYYFGGVQNQSVLVAIKSPISVQNVSLNDLSNMSRVSASTTLLGQNNQGWYYDNSSNILFVKYLSHANDSVRVFYSSQNITQKGNLFFYPTPLEFAVIFLIVAGASSSAYVYVQYRNKKSQK